MKRRNCVKTLAACAAAAVGGTTLSFGQSTNKRPNILFFFTDDQRFDTVHALGNRYIQTPAMDRLVQHGVSFTQAHIMGGNWGAVCAPSRAMLLTGRPYFQLPLSITMEHKAPPKERGGPYVTWPEVFRTAGYDTFGTGKQHNSRQLFARQFSHGASIFFGGMSDQLHAPVYDFDPSGVYPKTNEQIADTFSSELFSDAAINFLKNRDAGRPFCLYLSYTSPHDPRMAPKEYKALYDAGNVPMPENFMPRHPFDNGEMEIRDETLAAWPRTRGVIADHIAAYYSMITHVDAQIGRVLRTLDETGETDNTIIIFAGDNGLALGQHGLMGKQNLYDHSIRVPLVMCGPGLPGGERRDTPCYLFDIFPTLCDLTNQSIPESVLGKSLLPVIREEQRTLRSTMYFGYRDCQRAVRDDRYKLIEYVVGGVRTTQLFDLQQDPWEIHNLADDSSYAFHVSRLRAELLRLRDELGDTDPTFWASWN